MRGVFTAYIGFLLFYLCAKELSEKKKKKEKTTLAKPRALRKGHLKGRAPPHRPRGRGGTEVYTSKLASTMAYDTTLSFSATY
eukprot:1160630-Pelagomonas_calceolata.AAC.2